MKILLVNDYGTPAGGAELMTLALRRGLRERGHDARLLSGSALAGGGESQAEYTCAGTIGRFRTLLQTANPSAYCVLQRVLREFRPDVVHVRMFLTQLSPLVLPPLRGVASLYHVVWYRPICPLGTKMLPDGSACHQPPGTICYRTGCVPLRDWPLHMVQLKLWRRWRDAFDVIVANSHWIRRRLVAEGIEPVEVIHNGIPTVAGRPSLTGPPTVVAAGRLVREKGFDSLLRAFAAILPSIAEARLILAGDGPERQSLVGLINDLGIGHAVEMTGYMPRPELNERFSSAWVLAAPSRWAEPFGIVVPEAMMRGTAVVATNAGGFAESVRHDETGLLVEPGNDNALAAALARLLGDRGLCERMGAAGRKVALTHFREDVFIDRFVELYERILARRDDKPIASPVVGTTPIDAALEIMRKPSAAVRQGGEHPSVGGSRR